jgi:hypothetical protein
MNFTSAVATVRNDAPFKHHLKMKRFEYKMGKFLYKGANRLLITADCGGSNGYKVRLWKWSLQKLADEFKMELHVCHFPPGTSKWNKI